MWLSCLEFLFVLAFSWPRFSHLAILYGTSLVLGILPSTLHSKLYLHNFCELLEVLETDLTSRGLGHDIRFIRIRFVPDPYASVSVYMSISMHSLFMSPCVSILNSDGILSLLGPLLVAFYICIGVLETTIWNLPGRGASLKGTDTRRQEDKRTREPKIGSRDRLMRWLGKENVPNIPRTKSKRRTRREH